MQQTLALPFKSYFLDVTPRRLIALPQLLIGSDQTKEISSFKYLGFYIDTQLKDYVQIQYIKSKLRHLCGLLFIVDKFLSYEAATNMCNSSIYSVLSYCRK